MSAAAAPPLLTRAALSFFHMATEVAWPVWREHQLAVKTRGLQKTIMKQLCRLITRQNRVMLIRSSEQACQDAGTERVVIEWLDANRDWRYYTTQSNYACAHRLAKARARGSGRYFRLIDSYGILLDLIEDTGL